MPDDVDVLELPPRLDAAAAARRHVRTALTGWELEDLVEPVLLLTSEVVTNALLHAGTTLQLTVRREGVGARVEVADGSPVRPVRRRHSPTATTGRGVQLLDELADDWGATSLETGKLVWFVVLSGESWAGFFDVDLVGLAEP